MLVGLPEARGFVHRDGRVVTSRHPEIDTRGVGLARPARRHPPGGRHRYTMASERDAVAGGAAAIGEERTSQGRCDDHAERCRIWARRGDSRLGWSGRPQTARLSNGRRGDRASGRGGGREAERFHRLESRCRDWRSERLTAPLHSRGCAARSHRVLRGRVRSEGRWRRGMAPVRRALRIASVRPRRRSRAERSWHRNACGGPR